MQQQPFQNQHRVSVYQVEFNAIATGKIIAMSKRRIRWRYGFPNEEAVNAGESGAKCRGEEHDVTLTWSVSSGKRMIMSNGKQIYVGMNKTSVFEHRWTDSRGNDIRMVSHATAPLSSTSKSRQYDLFVNGKSFFELPKAYEIGLRGPSDSRIPGVNSQSIASGSPRRSMASYSNSGRNIIHRPDENMDDLKKAIEASLRESKDHLTLKGRLPEETNTSSNQVDTEPPQTKQESFTPQPKADEPLIDLLSEPAATVQPAQTNALVLVDAEPQQYQVDPFALGQTSEKSGTVFDEFAPKAPTYNDVSSQILLNYHSPTSSANMPVNMPANMPAQQSAVYNQTSNQSNVVVDEFAPKAPTYSDLSNQILMSYNSPTHAGMQSQQPGVPYQQSMVANNTPSNPFDDVPQNFTQASSVPNNNYQQNNTVPQQNMYQPQQQF